MDRWQIKWFCSFNFNSVFVLKKDVSQKTRKRNSFDLIRSDFYSIIFFIFCLSLQHKKFHFVKFLSISMFKLSPLLFTLIRVKQSEVIFTRFLHLHTIQIYQQTTDMLLSVTWGVEKKAILNISIYFWRLPIDFQKQWEPFPNLSEVKIVWRDFSPIHVRPWWVYAEGGV